jgi:hypothetical protein
LSFTTFSLISKIFLLNKNRVPIVVHVAGVDGMAARLPKLTESVGEFVINSTGHGLFSELAGERGRDLGVKYFFLFLFLASLFSKF